MNDGAVCVFFDEADEFWVYESVGCDDELWFELCYLFCYVFEDVSVVSVAVSPHDEVCLHAVLVVHEPAVGDIEDFAVVLCVCECFVKVEFE